MNTKIRQTIIAAVLASGTILSTGTAAMADCGLECWLSNTFSTNDFVGDWLRDTFGPVHDNGGEGNNETIMGALKASDRIVAEWKPGQKMWDNETLAHLKPSCELSNLLKVVNENQTPEAVIKLCFKQAR